MKTNESLLADALGKRGADVKSCDFQPGEDGAKVGLDGYLARFRDAGAHARGCLKDAEDPEPPAPKK